MWFLSQPLTTRLRIWFSFLPDLDPNHTIKKTDRNRIKPVQILILIRGILALVGIYFHKKFSNTNSHTTDFELLFKKSLAFCCRGIYGKTMMVRGGGRRVVVREKIWRCTRKKNSGKEKGDNCTKNRANVLKLHLFGI